MSKCPNCGTCIGCSCQGCGSLRVATDGAQVCTKCIQSYELSLKIKAKSPKTNINEA